MSPKLTTNRKGISLVGVLIASVLVLISLVYSLRILNASRKAAATGWDEVVAQLYAAELLELFRAMPTADLLGYLQVNPANDTLPPYYFCAHVNLANRTTGQIVNPDPVAALPVTPFDWTSGSTLASVIMKPNRFYQVNIINIKTMAINTARCVADARSEGVPPTETLLAADERLMVTVGVSWIPKGQTVASLRQTTLSAVIPE